jgi:histidinol phosphatase-like PHP family hydrolase
MGKVTRFGLVVVLGLLLLAPAVSGQTRREIQIPDIMGYKTLKCDFHMHTVFSDGSVWPTVRVDEAWREGLDVISITDHIEYQPHEKDIPTNHNRPYEIALGRANDRGILLIRGAEITRDTPPGHFNAIFLKDVEPLDTEDLIECMAAAQKQGAFIFWNHPGWKPEHKGWFDIHTKIYEKKFLRGIEVVNGRTYYPEAHEWALEKGLTFIGNSDIHAPLTLEETTPEEHRPMTLVFAKAKSVPAVKDAIEKGRTAIWFEKQLIGKQEYLQALFYAMVTLGDVKLGEKNSIRFRASNRSDVDIELERAGSVGPKSLSIPAGSAVLVRAELPEIGRQVDLKYVATNFLIGPDKGLPVTLSVPGKVTIDIGVETSGQ